MIVCNPGGNQLFGLPFGLKENYILKKCKRKLTSNRLSGPFVDQTESRVDENDIGTIFAYALTSRANFR